MEDKEAERRLSLLLVSDPMRNLAVEVTVLQNYVSNKSLIFRWNRTCDKLMGYGRLNYFVNFRTIITKRLVMIGQKSREILGHFCGMRRNFFNSHLSSTDTILQRTPFFNGQLSSIE